jgi:hypothetical protein
MSQSAVIFGTSLFLIVAIASMWGAVKKGWKFPTWLMWTVAVFAIGSTVYTDRGRYWQTTTLLTNLVMLFGVSAPLIQRYRGKW